jgi:hypothetical protein
VSAIIGLVAYACAVLRVDGFEIMGARHWVLLGFAKGLLVRSLGKAAGLPPNRVFLTNIALGLPWMFVLVMRSGQPLLHGGVIVTASCFALYFPLRTAFASWKRDYGNNGPESSSARKRFYLLLWLFLTHNLFIGLGDGGAAVLGSTSRDTYESVFDVLPALIEAPFLWQRLDA